MDVPMTFLNRNPLEDVYHTFRGFVNPREVENIYKLQDPFMEYLFDETIKQLRLIKNEDRPCAYKKVSGSTIILLVLYVDDILLIENDIPTLQHVKTWLGNYFSMKDLGEASYMLGIRFYRDRSLKLLDLCQSTYVNKVLRHFNMHDSKKDLLPMSHGILLFKEEFLLHNMKKNT
ncbi:hypothetical protein CR513_61872, partial [Mucuna pruriens]